MKRRVIQRRVVVFLLLLLAGGAIVNVAVAWGCATLIDPNDVPMSVESAYVVGKPIATIGTQSRPGHLRVNRRVATAEEERDWNWSNVAKNDNFRSEDYAGWPLLSMYCFNYSCIRFEWEGIRAQYYNKPSLDGVVGGISVPPWTTGRVGNVNLATRAGTLRMRQQVWRAFPLFAIWPGFAINTIVYAAILWVVFFVPGKVKRTLRRRRGLCPACAYPIGSSPVCTECGNQIPFPLRGRAREGVGRTETSHAHDDAERSTHPLAPSLKGGGKDPE